MEASWKTRRRLKTVTLKIVNIKVGLPPKDVVKEFEPP